MAGNHTYRIDLNLQQTTQSKQAVKELQNSFKQSDKSIEELNKDFNKLQQNGVDAGNAYRKVLHDEIDAYDKKLQQLDEEKVKLIANKNLTKDQLDQGLKDIAAKKKRMTAYQRELQVRLKIQKLTGKTVNEESKMVKVGSKMLEIQEKMNKLLGKESKIRQGISKAAKAGVKIAKGAGVAAGIAGAVVAGSMSAAQGQADKDKALQSLKSGIDPSLVDQVYIKTGADFPTIVNALNTLIDVTKDKDTLLQGATLEVQNPGFGATLLSSKSGANDIEALNTIIRQVKSQTGLQDVSAALAAAQKARTVSRGTVSQAEYLQAYGQLKGAGFDDEKIDRIIRSVASKGGDFIDQWNKTNLAAYTHDLQLRNRLAGMDLSLERIDPNRKVEQTPAEKLAEKAREVALKKDELMIKLIPIVNDLLDAIEPVAKDIMDGLANFLTKAVPKLTEVIMWIWDKLKAAAEAIKEGAAAVANAYEKQADSNSRSPTLGLDKAMRFANGGIATQPSICGEAGPELVLPLTKPQRCEQLMNQYLTTNNFNIQGNPNALGLSQQINNHKFIRSASMW